MRISWKDEQSIPKEATVRDLREIGKQFAKNTRCMKVVQEAECDYGRGTMFDEHTKVLVICQKTRGASDLRSHHPMPSVHVAVII